MQFYKRGFLTCLFLGFALMGLGQPKLSAYIGGGASRIALHTDLGIKLSVEQHEFHVGGRLASPGALFEKFSPGINLGYHHFMHRFKNWGLKLGAESAFFHQDKEDTKLTVFTPFINFKPDYYLNDNFVLSFKTGIGMVFAQGINKQTEHWSNFNYLNYQIGLDFIYCFKY